jgi:hypothetical protein
MKGGDTMKVSDQSAEELKALETRSDAEIDTSDIPERLDWTGAVRGRFRQPTVRPMATAPPTRMSDAQKKQIRSLLLSGMSRFDIAARVGVTPGQVSAIKAWMTMTMSAPPINFHEPGDAEGDEIVEAVETTFGLERDLQRELRNNIAQLDPELSIIDGNRERAVTSGGRIDILAKDRSGGLVVIELKAGRADRDAIGQILGYMGELMEETGSVRGILVAAEFSPRAIAAAKAASNIRLVRYGIQFSFKPITARAA